METSRGIRTCSQCTRLDLTAGWCCTSVAPGLGVAAEHGRCCCQSVKTTSFPDLGEMSSFVAPAPLPPPVPLLPVLGLAGRVPLVIRLRLREHRLVFLDLDLDLTSPSLPADAGDEEHVANDVDRPWVSGTFLSDEDRCGVAGVTCALVSGCRGQCYLTGPGC